MTMTRFFCLLLLGLSAARLPAATTDEQLTAWRAAIEARGVGAFRKPEVGFWPVVLSASARESRGAEGQRQAGFRALAAQLIDELTRLAARDEEMPLDRAHDLLAMRDAMVQAPGYANLVVVDTVGRLLVTAIARDALRAGRDGRAGLVGNETGQILDRLRTFVPSPFMLAAMVRSESGNDSIQVDRGRFTDLHVLYADLVRQTFADEALGAQGAATTLDVWLKADRDAGAAAALLASRSLSRLLVRLWQTDDLLHVALPALVAYVAAGGADGADDPARIRARLGMPIVADRAVGSQLSPQGMDDGHQVARLAQAARAGAASLQALARADPELRAIWLNGLTFSIDGPRDPSANDLPGFAVATIPRARHLPLALTLHLERRSALIMPLLPLPGPRLVTAPGLADDTRVAAGALAVELAPSCGGGPGSVSLAASPAESRAEATDDHARSARTNGENDRLFGLVVLMPAGDATSTEGSPSPTALDRLVPEGGRCRLRMHYRPFSEAGTERGTGSSAFALVSNWLEIEDRALDASAQRCWQTIADSDYRRWLFVREEGELAALTAADREAIEEWAAGHAGPCQTGAFAPYFELLDLRLAHSGQPGRALGPAERKRLLGLLEMQDFALRAEVIPLLAEE